MNILNFIKNRSPSLFSFFQKGSLTKIPANPIPSFTDSSKKNDSVISLEIKNLIADQRITKKASRVRDSPKWTVEEKTALIEFRRQNGLSWKIIAEKYFPERTIGAIRFQYYKLTKQKLVNSESLYIKNTKWTPKEDMELISAVKKYGKSKISWKAISSTGIFLLKTPRQLSERYFNILLHPKRGQWTKEEEEKLKSLVKKFGNQWGKMSHFLERPAKSIKRHYIDFLTPWIKKGPWTEEENQNLIKGLQEYGKDWKKVRKLFPGRRLYKIIKHSNSRNFKKILQESEITLK
ncbi:hypothetical protein G9A89_007277 [Geosiphon pyriformis]|nr:hypothetical protein G9A89_007277 [Geosiphon pyriformis]